MPPRLWPALGILFAACILAGVIIVAANAVMSSLVDMVVGGVSTAVGK